jgi:tRNA modification GTPase
VSVATIAAVATPSGVGALGVIRISGPDAFGIARALGGLHEGPVDSARALLRTLRADGEVLDQVLVLPFVGPRSFTGEDVVELHCHGGEVNVRRVLDAVLERGARVAEPGEFARRALANGKLDVVQVEAIADVIHAESEAGLRLAQSHLEGRLSREVDALKESLATLVALVEAAIDFSAEEHVYTIGAEEIVARLDPVTSGIDALLATYDAGRLRHSGVRVAIVGAPNAGKSTLLNVLMGEDRAIVTATPGTTRDTIEESVDVGGVRFRLVDTAGIRATEDDIEAMGIERTRAAAQKADAVLLVVAVGDEEAGATVAAELGDRPWGLLVNKADLAPGGERVREAAARVVASSGRTPSVVVAGSLAGGAAPLEVLRAVGAVSGSDAGGEAADGPAPLGGLEALLLGLAESAGFRRGTESVLLSRARHRELLEDARGCLVRARGAAEADLGHELVAFDLRRGLDALGGLTGAVTTDAVLERIFGEFCIGK